MAKLENGQRFPDVRAPAVEGGTLRLPEELAGSWALVVFYRGHF